MFIQRIGKKIQTSGISHQIRTKKSAAVLLVAGSLLAQSEISQASAKQKSGYYEGQLEVFEKFQESSTGQGPLAFRGSKLAGVTVRRVGWDGIVEIVDPNTGSPLMEPIEMSSEVVPKWGHLWKMKMRINSLGTELSLRKVGDCFKGHSLAHEYEAEICIKQNQNLSFSIRRSNGVPILQLSAFPFSQPQIPSNRPLTLSQAIRIALDTSPSSQQELLRKRAAREQINTAWLRLLPRINAPTIAQLFMPLATAPRNYALSIGTIAPFLSINAWIAMDEARRNSEIANIGFTISQANLVNQVEQAIYAYRRDLTLYSEYKDILSRLQGTREHLRVEIEKMKKADTFISDGIVDSLDQYLQLSINLVKVPATVNFLADDKHAIAQSLGIHDLEIIRDIKIGPEPISIENASKLQIYDEVARAEETSLRYLERFQAQKATAFARAERVDHPFRLFDFAGNPTDGFGFNLIGEFKLDKYQVRAAELNEQIVADQVRRTVSDAAENYNDAIDGYRNAVETRNRLRVKLDSLLNPLQEFDFEKTQSDALLSKISGGAIETLVKDLLQFTNLTRSYQAAFRMARATLERSKLMYDYEQLRPEAQQKPRRVIDRGMSVPEDDTVMDTNQIEGEASSGSVYHLYLQKGI